MTEPTAPHRPDLPARVADPATELGLLALPFIWGINFPLIKIGLAVIPPLAFNTLRFPLAAVTLYVLLRLGRGVRRPEAGDVLRLVGLGLLGNAVYQLLFITGVARTSAGNASLLLSTTPVWTALLSVAARHESLPVRVWQGIGLAVVGMVLVVAGGPGVQLDGGTLAGDLLMVGAALTWAGYTVGSHPMIRKYGAMQVTAWTLWAGTPVVVLMGVPWLPQVSPSGVTPMTAVSVLYAGVMAVGVAYLLWNRGVRVLGNARTAIYSNTVPIVAMASAWVLLGEVPTVLQGVGAGVILTGLSLSRVRRRRRPGPGDDGGGPRETRTQ